MRILLTETNWTSLGLARDLQEEGFLVTRAGDGEEALHMAEFARNDAVLIDTDLPDMDFEEVLATITMRVPGLPVFVIGGADRGLSTAEVLDLGADDIFGEPLDPVLIGQRIRAVVRRARGLSSPQIELGGLTVNLASAVLSYGGRTIGLTRYEYEIIEMLALRPGQIIARDDIMTQLYALEDEPSEKIIDVYLSRIRGKLRAAGHAADILRSARNRGVSLWPCQRDMRKAA